jgi:hypothetical protein
MKQTWDFYFIKRNLAFSYFETVSVNNEIHEPYSNPLRVDNFYKFLESPQQSEKFNKFRALVYSYKGLFKEIKMFSVSEVVSE